jgi:hypothetical protein
VPTRGGDRLTHNLPPGYYTRTQLAERVGMPIETLRRWLANDEYVPHESGQLRKHGKVEFWLFTESDVVNLRAMCRQRNVKHRRRMPPSTVDPTQQTCPKCGARVLLHADMWTLTKHHPGGKGKGWCTQTTLGK